MGFQFVHFEGFSRQGGKSGRTTDFVFGEAARRPDACPHVGEQQPPETVFGVGIKEVQALHDERAAIARDLMSNGRSRAIRKTQQTLATVIASHPFTIAEVRNDSAKAAAVAAWERRTVAWLCAKYGDQLVGVVRHVDERFCHLHAYLLPGNAMMKVSDLHPGHVAKAAVVDAGPRRGEDAKALNRRGDQAYREAMRRWQDSYHQHVGVPCGLARLGPGKRRLKRAEWHDEKRQADALRSTLSKAMELRANGDAFTSKVRLETAKLQADAARAADAAKVAEERAHKREETARRAAAQAERATTVARRLSGLGGALRGFWDGIRRSKLAARLREELLPIVERWQQAEAAARAAAAAESDRRVAAEKRASVLSGSVAEIGAQRDELRARLARYEPAAVVAPVPARPQP